MSITGNTTQTLDFPPIFIGGSGSSGSTLLSVILDNHPDVACGPELALFNKSVIFKEFEWVRNRFSQWLRKGVKTNGYFKYYRFCANIESYAVTKDMIETWLNKVTSIREFLDQFITHYLQYRHKHIFAEKTPSNAYTFPELLEIYPDARFIHIYRDGRDVVCSLRKRGYTWFQASSMWLYNTVAAMRLEHNANYFALSYNELVKKPENTIRKLCEFLNIQFDKNMLVLEKSNRNATGKASENWLLNPTAGSISTKSLKRYKAELSHTGAWIYSRTKLTGHGKQRSGSVYEYTSDVMKHLNYKMEILPEKSLQNQTRAVLEKSADYTYRSLQSLKHGNWPEKPLTTVDGCF